MLLSNDISYVSRYLRKLLISATVYGHGRNSRGPVGVLGRLLRGGIILIRAILLFAFLRCHLRAT